MNPKWVAQQRITPVTVTADDRSNTLIVTAGKESLSALERMIDQLDSQDAVAKTNFRVIPLKRTTAMKLQSTLQRLFVNRPARIKGEPSEPISVVADSWANVIIVGASVDDLAMVESLVERLDSEQSDSRPGSSRCSPWPRPMHAGSRRQYNPCLEGIRERVEQAVWEGGLTSQLGISVNVDERP